MWNFNAMGYILKVKNELTKELIYLNGYSYMETFVPLPQILLGLRLSY